MADNSGIGGIPLVSVILPTHRPNPYFSEALASVRAQSWPSVELIVVDDGWSDRELLAQIVGDDAATRIVHHDPAGIARSRNHGVAESSGSLIAFLDHDDVWDPEHLATLVAAIETEPTASASFGCFDLIDAHGHVLRKALTGPSTIDDVLGGGSRPSINSFLARRDLVVRIGGFEPLLEPADDLDLIYKLVAEGPFVYSDVTTAGWRQHDTNTSRDLIYCAEAANRMLQLHLSAAEARGDERAVRLLNGNRTLVQNYWTTAARKQAVRAWRSGDRREAARLLRWCTRYSPRAFARDIVLGAGRKLTPSLSRGQG